jgi:hypothetical protein
LYFEVAQDASSEEWFYTIFGRDAKDVEIEIEGHSRKSEAMDAAIYRIGELEAVRRPVGEPVIVFYESEHFRVRILDRGRGRRRALLVRPERNATLARFNDPAEAAYIARYCERFHNGSFAAEARNAAKRSYAIRSTSVNF